MTQKRVTDDGLTTSNIGVWSERKHDLVYLYARMFATSMKKKWDFRLYVDLFAGSGRGRIEGTSRIVLTSPLLALEVPDRFDRYIFCEKDPEQLNALITRAKRDYPNVDTNFIAGDCNKRVQEILNKFPRPRKNYKVLAFCFADPFQLENLHFSTIEQLAIRYIDFLILIPTWMDANRNVPHYFREDNKTLDNFVGTPTWRTEWQHAIARGENFDRFLTNFYASRMNSLKYQERASEQTILIRSTGRNLPLYRLAFSRHKLGERIWNEAKKYADPQISFNFE
jgi:three-Cys-motif partner protein